MDISCMGTLLKAVGFSSLLCWPGLDGAVDRHFDSLNFRLTVKVQYGRITSSLGLIFVDYLCIFSAPPV